MLRKALSLVLLFAVIPAACGKSSTTDSPKRVKLTVGAGARLDDVFPKIGTLFTKRYSGVTFDFAFGLVDDIVEAIKQGQYADVFAAPDRRYGEELVSAGKLDAYTDFAANQLVVITPTANPAGIATLEDLRTKPIKLLIGDEASLSGSTTRTMLPRLDAILGPGYAEAVLGKATVVPGAVEVLAMVEGGQADAGFVFNGEAFEANVNRIPFPPEAEAHVSLIVAVLKGSKNPAEANRFVEFLLTPPAQALLEQDGFSPPPSSSP